jgi:PKHD-type hydroxylase
MLLKIPKIMSAEETHRVLHTLAHAPAGEGWADGRATAGTQGAQAKNNQQMPEHSATTAKARDVVIAALAKSAQFMTGALPKRIYPPSFNRYAQGTNAFGSHIDNAVRSVPAVGGLGGYLRTDLSCTLFLTPPESYDGGELVIESPSGEQFFKLAAGDMLLYPANTVHRVNPVTRGERIASFFWVESLIASNEQRQLLYELDMGIYGLRSGGGESAETVRLTGVYHNLLRMWAHT